MSGMPLSVMIENAKAKMISAFNQIQAESNLPAYLLEGVVLDLLSQVRNQKNLEIVADYNRVKEGTKSGEQDTTISE